MQECARASGSTVPTRKGAVTCSSEQKNGPLHEVARAHAGCNQVVGVGKGHLDLDPRVHADQERECCTNTRTCTLEHTPHTHAHSAQRAKRVGQEAFVQRESRCWRASRSCAARTQGEQGTASQLTGNAEMYKGFR